MPADRGARWVPHLGGRPVRPMPRRHHLSGDAATLAGVGGGLREFRGYRSCLAQAPAHRWHPSGMGHGGGNEIGFMGIVGLPSPNLECARLLTYPEWRSAKAMHRGFWMIGGTVETSFIASRDHRTAL